MEESESIQNRTKDVFFQLERYGHQVFSEEIVDILEALSDINDDLWNGRHPQLITDGVEKTKKLLDELKSKYGLETTLPAHG